MNLALKLYSAYLYLDIQLPQSDRGLADDAVILAAMTLLQIYHIGHREALFQCVMVLEYLISHSKHNYDAILILIRLYMYLGIGSMAMDRYSHLSIKNIQHATISWVLVTRLSTIHPWPSRILSHGIFDFDPLEELEQALDWHRGASTLTNKATNAMVSKKQWNMIIGLLETQSALQNGLGYASLKVECLRIRRLRAVSRDRGRKLSNPTPSIIQDNLDRTPFPNCRPVHQATFEESLPAPLLVPCLDTRWLSQEYGLAQLWDSMEGQYGSLEVVKRLRDVIDHIRAYSDASSDNPRSHDAHIISLLASLIPLTNIVSNVSPIREKASKILDEVSMQLEIEHRRASTFASLEIGSFFSSGDRGVPLWITFHFAFTLIERLNFITRYLDKSMKKDHLIGFSEPDELSEKVIVIRKRCQEVRETVHSGAKNWRAKICLIPFEDILTSSNRGIGQDEEDWSGELCNLVGPEMVSSICMIFREGYLDAFDGVIRSSEP